MRDDVQVPRHEDVWGSGIVAPCSFNLCARGRWVVSFTSREKVSIFRKIPYD